MKKEFIKESGERKNYYFALVAIVGIVAIIGIIFMVTNQFKVEEVTVTETNEGISTKETTVGEAIIVPAQDGVHVGDLILLPVPIYAPVTTEVSGDLFRYVNSDNVNKRNPILKLVSLTSGETIETNLGRNGEAIFNLNGKNIKVKMLKPNVDNSPIQVDFDADGIIDNLGFSKKELNYLPATIPVHGYGITCNAVMTLLEEESQVYNAQNIELTFIDAQKVKINVDGIESSDIFLGGSEKVNGIPIDVLNILFQNFAGGIHQASLCLH